MKKQLIITALALVVSASAFGQGYVVFASTKSAGVSYNPGAAGGTNATAVNGNGGISVGFIWAASGTPLVGTSGLAVGQTAITPDWSKILTDPTFHFAQNAGALVSVALNNSGLAQGGWTYNGSVSFPLTGSTPGSVIEIVAVAYSSAYTTPQAAAAGGSFLGYSGLFNYTTGADSGAAVSTFALSGMGAFGVSPVPEPATFALAGLGAAAMLIFRRRK
jgi:hypothetical protein